MRYITLTAFAIVLTGCATQGGQSGLWKDLRATKKASTFHTAKYTGSELECFPPINKRWCNPVKNNKFLYEETGNLNIEEYTLSMSTRGFFDQARVRDMLFLAASDLTIQRGFLMFTITKEIEISMCRSFGYEARTDGSINSTGFQNNYSGKTVISPSQICGGSDTIQIIIFNDKIKLADGVFKRSNNGSARWLYPESSLYIGTMSNLDDKDYNDMPDRETKISTPLNAWKIHYDARGLAADLRAKYKLGEPENVYFKDEMADRLNYEAKDPIKKNRHSTE